MYSVPWAPSLPHQYNTKSNPHCQWMLNVFVPVFRVIGPISVWFFVHFSQFLISLSDCTLPNDGLHELQENRPGLPENESVESAIFVFRCFAKHPSRKSEQSAIFNSESAGIPPSADVFFPKSALFGFMNFVRFHNVMSAVQRKSLLFTVICPHLADFS